MATKRYTHKQDITNANYVSGKYCDMTNFGCFQGEAIDYLAELEDKIEKGLLVEFPCKDKTPMYCIEKKCDGCPYAHYGWEDFYCDKEGYECSNDIVDEECKKHFAIRETTFSYNARHSIYGTPQYRKGVDETNYEYTYFLDKKQAEQKLKELQGESK